MSCMLTIDCWLDLSEKTICDWECVIHDLRNNPMLPSSCFKVVETLGLFAIDLLDLPEFLES